MVQQRLCLTCATPFDVPPTSRRKFCSAECQPRKSHSTKVRPAVDIECARCGTPFKRKAWVADQATKKGWAQYCSTACRDSARRGRKGERRVADVVLTCPQCKAEFGVAPNEARRRTYCSLSCAAKAHGGRPRSGKARFTGREGYVSVYVEMDERPPGQDSRPYHFEHRYVMSKALGRWPTRHETVHHINGDKTDNRPENLQLRSGNHGRGHVLRCRCCGSSDIESVELT